MKDVTTLLEIANLARVVYSGYPDAAKAYARSREDLETVRLRGWVEREPDALQGYIGTSKRCKTYSEKLSDLEKLVVTHLPGLWPELRLVAPAARWHENPGFDWPAAERELRTIEATARAAAQQLEEPRPAEPEAKPAAGKSSTPPREPSKKALQAWSVRVLLGITDQTEIAEEMTRRGTVATQGQVSKWLGQVERYLAAGGMLPDYGNGKKPESIDPAILEIGARQDHLTPRQRQRRDPDADSGGE